MTTSRDTDTGFTLLEVLIALVIAGLALGVLFHGSIAGLLATQTAGRYEEAVERARSHLAALADAGKLAPLDATGDDGGGYRWMHRVATISTDASPLGARPSSRAAGPPITLFSVSVAITWTADGGTRAVRLNTERLGQAARMGP
jgi:general secretion pathway protein I